MSVPLLADQPHPSPVLVSRQPVLDARDRVVGYRISYSLLTDGVPVTPTPLETAEVVDDLLSVIDPEERVTGNMAHLRLSSRLIESSSEYRESLAWARRAVYGMA